MIGMHTGVLQDRTLDMVRAHDEMMLTLKQHGHQKREEREKAFIDLVSTEFVGGFNGQISELQLGKIKGFSDEATQIYKDSSNGRISMDDQVRLRAQKAELEAFQANLRQAAQVVDKARQTLVRDGGRNFDVEESTAKMNEFLEGWEGDTPIDMNDLLEASYINMPEWLNSVRKSLQVVNRATKERTWLEGDQQKTERKQTSKLLGASTPEQAIQTLESRLKADNNALRSADKGFLEIKEAADETGNTGVLDDIVSYARDLEEQGADPETSMLLSSLLVSEGKTVEDLFALGSRTDREREHTGSSIRGKKVGQHSTDISMTHDGETYKGISPQNIRIPVSGEDLALKEGQRVRGTQLMRVDLAGYDGTVLLSYTGRRAFEATKLPGGRFEVGGEQIEVPKKQFLSHSDGVDTKQLAIRIYKEMRVLGDVKDVEYNEETQEWIPFVGTDAQQGQTVVYKMKEDYKDDSVYKLINTQYHGFAADFEAGRKKYEPSGGTRTTRKGLPYTK